MKKIFKRDFYALSVVIGQTFRGDVCPLKVDVLVLRWIV